MEITVELKKLGDSEYGDFQAKLTPTVPRDKMLGVRVPVLRQFAKKIAGTCEAKEFIKTLPHKFYDEYMLHGLLISLIKDPNEIIKELDKFLPYVDNWAVCDICSPKSLKKDKETLLAKIREWTKSKGVYTVRFAVEMLMSFYLDDDFKPEYLEIPAKVVSTEYYVNMMLAWFFATALTKQWESTLPYIEQNKLPTWVHNKTIQKAIESYRITDEQKEYLRSKKIK